MFNIIEKYPWGRRSAKITKNYHHVGRGGVFLLQDALNHHYFIRAWDWLAGLYTRRLVLLCLIYRNF